MEKEVHGNTRIVVKKKWDSCCNVRLEGNVDVAARTSVHGAHKRPCATVIILEKYNIFASTVHHAGHISAITHKAGHRRVHATESHNTSTLATHAEEAG